MKRQIIPSLCLFLAYNTAHAQLPASAISTLDLSVFGMYTTSDPTCQTGLTATIPLSATPTVFNFAADPALGTGSVSSPINCVVFILKAATSITYAAGSYTTSSTGGGGTNPDSACNAGGTLLQKICRGTTTNFPTQVTTDAAAVGLTLTTTCPSSPTGNEVIPVYLSIDAACTGVNALDAGNTACVTIDSGNGPNAFQAPTAAADTSNGLLLTALPGGGGSYKFVVGVSNSVGGEGGGQCGGIDAPTFAITN